MAFEDAINKATYIYSLIYFPDASLTTARNTVDKVEDNFVYFTTPMHKKRKALFTDFAEKLREDKRNLDDIVLAKIKEHDPYQGEIDVMYFLDDKTAIRAMNHFDQYALWFSHIYDENNMDDEELNNWLIGLTSHIKHIVKNDKKINLNDVKKYVHEYIDKNLCGE